MWLVSAANNHHRRATNLVVTTETEIAPSLRHSRYEPSQAPHPTRNENFVTSLFAWNAKVISWLLSCYENVFVGHHHFCPNLPWLTTVGKSCALALLDCLMVAPSWLDLVKIRYFGLCEVLGWELGLLAGMLKQTLHKHVILLPLTKIPSCASRYVRNEIMKFRDNQSLGIPNNRKFTFFSSICHTNLFQFVFIFIHFFCVTFADTQVYKCNLTSQVFVRTVVGQW